MPEAATCNVCATYFRVEGYHALPTSECLVLLLYLFCGVDRTALTLQPVQSAGKAWLNTWTSGFTGCVVVMWYLVAARTTSPLPSLSVRWLGACFAVHLSW